MDKLESLLNSKGVTYSKRWKPNLVNQYKNVISSGYLQNLADEVRSNISYSLQYLEFLQLQLNELNLHSMIEKMIYKNYIIISISVIEAILEEMIKFNGLQTQVHFTIVGKEIDSNEFLDEHGIRKKVRTQILQAVEKPIDVQMKLDDLLKKVKSRNNKKNKPKILNFDREELRALNEFRRLRNKVHLSNIEDGKTNWHEFSMKEYVTIKFLLHSILTDQNLENTNQQKYINFLILNDEERKLLNI
ncbi:hypothetical protein O3602_02770 [Streptococcus sp. 27098_8_186]|uniref:hypothetical protein n=1 Tax=Streptococcus TaxID=1301 RepID=UPI00352DC690